VSAPKPKCGEITIAELCRESFRTAHDSGWWGTETGAEPMTSPLGTCDAGARIALMHSELSEALEALRVGDTKPRSGDGGKPEGLPSELADVLIRIGDFCGRHGIDLEAAVLAKLAYNKTRPRRHGGKAL